MDSEQHAKSIAIKKLASEIGFTACAITSAVFLKEDAKRLNQWLTNGMHAGMHYMENYFDKRTNPSLLVPGAKSVIVVLLNYLPKKQLQANSYTISKYAYGKDYHQVMKNMLNNFRDRINTEIAPIKARCFVDSAPVLERSLAARGGLGWIAKNANLISPKHGSFCFIGELIIDAELVYDKPIPDFCGSCTKCITACPTQAIVEPGIVDSRKCISYWTIEHKGDIDPTLKGKFENNVFGCDICQDVCPWNRKPAPGNTPELQAQPKLTEMLKDNWNQLEENEFDALFKNSAIQRTGYKGIRRNIEFVKSTDELS